MPKIISKKELQEKYPLSNEQKEKIDSYRQTLKDIIDGKIDKKIVIIGPCSMDFEDSILEYAKKLKELADKKSDKFFFIMRCYSAKPRTTVGWKGCLYNGEFGSNGNLNNGLEFTRKLLLKITDIGLPVADEMLYPELTNYFDDCLSYVALGARSSENQSHREAGSHLDIPVGVKNPTSGDLNIACNSLIATRSPQQVCLGNDFFISSGNPYSHIILRGGNIGGKSISNYDENNLNTIESKLKDKNIENRKVVVDLNHDNSGKNGLKQVEIFDYLEKLENKNIIGYMIESYLFDGNQGAKEDDIDSVKKGLSITDHCLGIDKLKTLF